MCASDGEGGDPCSDQRPGAQGGTEKGGSRTTVQRGAEPPQDQRSPEHAAAFRLRGAAGSLAQVPKVSHPNHTRDWGGFIIPGPSRPRLAWLGVPGIFTWE